MSKMLDLTAEVVLNNETGKRRVLTHIYRDETISFQFIMDANEAEQWGAKLMFLANECRKKNPSPEKLTIRHRLRNRFKILKELLSIKR